MDLIKVAEQAFATNKQHPQFFPGDTITVAYRIKEGNKERIQQYRGVRSVSPSARSVTTSALSVFSRSSLRLSTASLSTSMVRCVALSCITCVVSPVRRLASRSAVSSRRTRLNRPATLENIKAEGPRHSCPGPSVFLLYPLVRPCKKAKISCIYCCDIKIMCNFGAQREPSRLKGCRHITT